ncbi:MAG: hypothetical protein R2831_10955 [Chitinophagaceae bacterium]
MRLQLKAVREMFRRGAKNYCSINLLEGLEYEKPIFKKDTEKNAFVYFKNKYLSISKAGITEHSYNELESFIWKKQVIEFDYQNIDYAQCDFNRFILLAVLGEKKAIDKYTEDDARKVSSIATTIGYLLHRYKNPAITKAVIAVDKQLRTNGENNGRTGKSLFSKALGKMLNMCLIDGKNFKFDSPFPFQKANIDTELINFNDVLKNFDFERLYGMITEEFTFEKKGKDSITLSFEDSPKFYISTNTSLKGGGDSNKGRQQIIEFSNYFNGEHTPVKEFGRMFFYDWDKEQYAMFYAYMIDCIRFYLENGLIEFPLENYEVNKLIDTAGEEFIEYMNDTVLGQMDFNNQFEPKKLMEAFISENKGKERLHQKTFNKWVRTWAELNELEINKHNNYNRYKSNGIEYMTFTHKN